jgi:hypothetical protein
MSLNLKKFLVLLKQ